jgi:hypothetical protein
MSIESLAPRVGEFLFLAPYGFMGSWFMFVGAGRNLSQRAFRTWDPQQERSVPNADLANGRA